MSKKVEKFIQENTRNCSNAIYDPYDTGDAITIYAPWLTPDQARKAVEIAREEMLNDICEWIEENIGEYCNGENIGVFGQERFINDLKQAVKDEQD